MGLKERVRLKRFVEGSEGAVAARALTPHSIMAADVQMLSVAINSSHDRG
jgi:hypothetical protein